MPHMTPQTVVLHGHELSYVDSGSGPAVLFIHGILGSQRQWSHLVDKLDDDHRVLVPDLFGHGDSAKPLGDYSLSAHAAAMRDLIDHLGIERVTLVGHSLGGGIAMQFFYLFPERVDRLVLVASGGLGREVNLSCAPRPCRAPSRCSASSPPLPSSRGSRRWVVARRRSAGAPAHDLGAIWRGFSSLGDRESRRAFLATTRAVIDIGGQSISAHDHLRGRAADPDHDRVGLQGPDDPGLARAQRAARAPRLPRRAVRGRGPLPAPRRPGPLRARAPRVHRRRLRGRTGDRDRDRG